MRGGKENLRLPRIGQKMLQWTESIVSAKSGPQPSELLSALAPDSVRLQHPGHALGDVGTPSITDPRSCFVAKAQHHGEQHFTLLYDHAPKVPPGTWNIRSGLAKELHGKAESRWEKVDNNVKLYVQKFASAAEDAIATSALIVGERGHSRRRSREKRRRKTRLMMEQLPSSTAE
ncbi:hypothetical protein LTR56_026671 [Elasticomyces elasticus]|nr:hypothetical protein LTR56_026671 [Elasticomyces elasticus]